MIRLLSNKRVVNENKQNYLCLNFKSNIEALPALYYFYPISDFPPESPVCFLWCLSRHKPFSQSEHLELF